MPETSKLSCLIFKRLLSSIFVLKKFELSKIVCCNIELYIFALDRFVFERSAYAKLALLKSTPDRS